MAASSKTPSASAISRLLSAAGFEKAVVKMRGGCSGFDVHADSSTGNVRVKHYSNTMGPSSDPLALTAYAKAITEAGYDVLKPSPRFLIVTAKEG